MNEADELVAELQLIRPDGDHLLQLEDLMERLRRVPEAEQSLPAVMRFIEDHPTADLGAPGPLVHFLEEFYGRGYEEVLLESLGRRPTEHSVWMLNRLLNGTEGETQSKLLERMRSIAHDERLAPNVRNLAAELSASAEPR